MDENSFQYTRLCVTHLISKTIINNATIEQIEEASCRQSIINLEEIWLNEIMVITERTVSSFIEYFPAKSVHTRKGE